VKVRLVAVVSALSLIAVVSAAVAYALGTSDGNTNAKIVLHYTGGAIANTHATPNTPTFDTWCGGACAPSVAQPVYNPETGDLRGTIYVWTKNFAYASDGNSLCFGEYIWYALSEGNVYADSGGNGTCGAFIDPSLKAPTHISNAKVIAGGGDGTIVGGTGKYAKWTGTYTDRVFVEFSLVGGSNYYDQLFFAISKN
jgi:hypothetical protein